jgi:MFS family permease
MPWTESSNVDCLSPGPRIFAGLAVDYYGPNTISIISSISNLAGALIAAVGASIGSFPTLIAGQIIGGFGNMAIETAQSKLYTRWFANSRHLAFVYGLDIAIGRVIK